MSQPTNRDPPAASSPNTAAMADATSAAATLLLDSDT